MNLMCNIVSLSFHLLCSILFCYIATPYPPLTPPTPTSHSPVFNASVLYSNATTICICIMPFFRRFTGRYVWMSESDREGISAQQRTHSNCLFVDAA